MMKKIILILVAGFICQFSFGQGPLDGFVDAPKTRKLALSLGKEKAKTYYLWNRDLLASNKFRSISLYYKQQFTKWLGIAVNVPLVEGKLHDGNIYLKFGKTFKLGKDFSLNGVLGAGHARALSDYKTQGSDAIGQQAEIFAARLITQLTYKNKMFLNLRVGHDEVKSPTPSANLYSIKVGYYKNKWYGDLWFEDITALGGKDYRGEGDRRASDFRELGVSSSKIGGVIYHQTKDKVGLFLSSSKAISGRNAWGSMRYSLGFVVSL